VRHLWHWRTATGLVVGGTAGALYSVYVGCGSGCAIWSSPVLAGLLGGLLGATLLAPAPRKPPYSSPSP
jgi:hypothetical protein